MTKSIKGTQTEKNLLTSFAGESQARMRYTYFASVAKKEGYEQIAAIFTETADQEKEHAKRMFKFLEGGMVEITASYPAGVIGNTLQNLQAAAAGEHEEWSLDYPHFADVAEQEGFPVEGVNAVFSLQNSRKAVDALAHVHHTVGQKDRLLVLSPIQKILQRCDGV